MSQERSSNRHLSRRDFLKWGVVAGVTAAAGIGLYEIAKPKERERISSSGVLLETRQDVRYGRADTVPDYIKSKLLLMDFEGNAKRVLDGDSSSWSPDGKHFVYRKHIYNRNGLEDSYWVLANSQNETELPISIEPKKSDQLLPVEIFWHPDGSILYYNDYDLNRRGIWGLKLSDNKPYQIIKTRQQRDSMGRRFIGIMDLSPYISPDGKKMAFEHSGANGAISVVDLDTDKFPYEGEYRPYDEKGVINHDFLSFDGLRSADTSIVGWSDDSQRIMYQTHVRSSPDDFYELFVADVESKSVRKIKIGGYITPESLSHDRNKAVSHGPYITDLSILDINNERISKLDIGDTDHRPHRWTGKPLINADFGFVENISWSAHDNEIIFTRHEVIYSIKPDGTDLKPFSTPTSGILNPYYYIDACNISPR